MKTLITWQRVLRSLIDMPPKREAKTFTLKICPYFLTSFLNPLELLKHAFFHTSHLNAQNLPPSHAPLPLQTNGYDDAKKHSLFKGFKKNSLSGKMSDPNAIRMSHGQFVFSSHHTPNLDTPNLVSVTSACCPYR